MVLFHVVCGIALALVASLHTTVKSQWFSLMRLCGGMITATLYYFIKDGDTSFFIDVGLCIFWAVVSLCIVQDFRYKNKTGST